MLQSMGSQRFGTLPSPDPAHPTTWPSPSLVRRVPLIIFPADLDECQLFRDQVCKSGVCVNTAPGYSCYCSNGYYYHAQRLECIGKSPPPPPSPHPRLGLFPTLGHASASLECDHHQQEVVPEV